MQRALRAHASLRKKRRFKLGATLGVESTRRLVLKEPLLVDNEQLSLDKAALAIEYMGLVVDRVRHSRDAKWLSFGKKAL
jgi:hypothetical protein